MRTLAIGITTVVATGAIAAAARADEPIKCQRTADGTGSAFTIDDPQWTCGYTGLGCVDDPRSKVRTDGMCGACLPDEGMDAPAGQRASGDCGGTVCSAARQCKGPPGDLHIIQPIRPKRFLLTATALGTWTDGVDGADGDLDVATGLGAFFQLGLRKSKVERVADNHVVHTVPSMIYAHVGATALTSTPRSVLLEGGVIWRIDVAFLTRLGLMYAGEIYGAPELLEEAQYRQGPSVHVEIMNNLIVKMSYLYRDPDDAAFIGVEYMKTLLDDIRRVDEEP